MGLAFFLKETYLLPPTAVLLVITVGSLAYRARRRRGYGPFVMGVVASVLLLASKLLIESNPAMYVSAGLLFAATIWNAWPSRKAKSGSATPAQTLHQIGSNESEIQQ